ncbi:MAG: GIY-YIG nuclease family protein [Bacteroidetes bacterium]|nr:GIY-YIG nuclease family protein [Bacteroidota bacterium]
MIACYILFSPSKNLFYTGFVQDSFEERLKKHNEGFYEKTFTSITNDWELFLLIDCNTIHEAICIEKHIKKMKSKIYIINLKKYPEMILKLKGKFRT